MTCALQTVGLSKCWGSLAANSEVTIGLQEGVRHALIGPNGAGKTTLVNVLAGSIKPTSGDVFLGSERITELSEHQRVKRGLCRTYQINTLFPNLTVLETILLAICERKGLTRTWFRAVSGLSAETDEADHILTQLQLIDDRDAETTLLPYGKQRLLEIALGLAMQPKILILDEPAAGIPAHESEAVFSIISRLPSDVTILFIEHDMDLVFRFAERVTVLVNGRVLTEGSPDEIAANEEVRRVYLGEVGYG